jgi:hypothetical protein
MKRFLIIFIFQALVFLTLPEVKQYKTQGYVYQINVKEITMLDPHWDEDYYEDSIDIENTNYGQAIGGEFLYTDDFLIDLNNSLGIRFF